MPLPITHLSVSSMKEHLGCPRKFRLRRLDKVAPEYRAAALALGTAFHDAVAFTLHRHSLAQPCSTEEQAEHFRDELNKQLLADGPPVLFADDETRDSLADKGTQMLERFWQEVPLPDRVIGIERRFRLEMHDPETGEVTLPLVGAIDAAVETKGRPVLWELKTGKARWPEDKLLHDFQATGYRIAFRQEHGVNPDLLLAVVTKTREPAVQLVPLRRGPEDERELLATASSICRAVEAGVDHPVRSWACKSCEFAGACR